MTALAEPRANKFPKSVRTGQMLCLANVLSPCNIKVHGCHYDIHTQKDEENKKEKHHPLRTQTLKRNINDLRVGGS